jgi:hypothetical protein
MRIKAHKLMRAIAVGLAAAALVTPSALADPWGSNALQQESGAPALLSEHGFGQNATAVASEPKNSPVFVAATSAASLVGEAKNVAPFVAQGQKRGRRGDRLVLDAPETRRVAAEIAERRGGFDWGDAGIGGAATLALVLLVAGAASFHHNSRRQEAHG